MTMVMHAISCVIRTVTITPKRGVRVTTPTPITPLPSPTAVLHRIGNFCELLCKK